MQSLGAVCMTRSFRRYYKESILTGCSGEVGLLLCHCCVRETQTLCSVGSGHPQEQRAVYASGGVFFMLLLGVASWWDPIGMQTAPGSWALVPLDSPGWRESEGWTVFWGNGHFSGEVLLEELWSRSAELKWEHWAQMFCSISVWKASQRRGQFPAPLVSRGREERSLLPQLQIKLGSEGQNWLLL